MPTATDLAQRQFKTGEFSPNYRLQIADGRFKSELYDATVIYSSDGTSEMNLSTDADLAQYTGEKVRLWTGYGDDLWEYFGGWLEEPEDNHWGGPSTAVAYGPFKEMAEASIGEDVSYAGWQLGPAIADLHARAGQAALETKYEIRSNPTFVLEGEQAGLSLATSFADGINTFLNAAGWISVDRPGFRRLYRPKPRPRPSAEAVAAYDEAHYEPGTFKAVLGKPYGSVGAYARDENGNLKWDPVVIGVDTPRKVSKLRTYWLTDFAGEEGDAWLECGLLAMLLSDGVYTWSLEGIPANPDLHMFDTIKVRTTELRDEGGPQKERYDVTYACTIDSELSVDVSREGHPMTLAGETAIKLRERKLKTPLYVARGSHAVIRG